MGKSFTRAMGGEIAFEQPTDRMTGATAQKSTTTVTEAVAMAAPVDSSSTNAAKENGRPSAITGSVEPSKNGNRPDLGTFPVPAPLATIGAPWRCPRCRAQSSVGVVSLTRSVASSSQPGDEAA
ncbi:MAG: hypothetical protein IPH13_22540 [Planctomycetes bacterium]|nr:hypothetical protein [Planctomycetota bacterium]